MTTNKVATTAMEQAYFALKKCAERIGRSHYRSGRYMPSKHHVAYSDKPWHTQGRTNFRDCILFPGNGAYRVSEEHLEIIQAMSDVLSRAISPDDAMGLIWRGDIEELRLAGAY